MKEFSWEWLAAAAGKSAVIAVLSFLVLRAIKKAIPKIIEARLPEVREETPEQRTSRAQTLSDVFVGVLKYVIWIVAALTILAAFGVTVWPSITSLGIGAVAIGFAADRIVRDYLVGFFTLIEDWYRVGERVIATDIEGWVEEVGLRHTAIRDTNGYLHNISNHKIDAACNEERDWARINLEVTVAHKENLGHVFDVINDVCEKLKDDPTLGPAIASAPRVARVDSLGPTGVVIKILDVSTAQSQAAILGELRRRIKDRFDEEGIEIPWPNAKVYFGNPIPESVAPK